MQKTTVLNAATIDKKWWLVDAKGQTMGRLATKIAMVLKGKHKPAYTPHVDCGDYVVVINADKVVWTGDKMNKKMYYNHSQYLSGLRVRPLKEMMTKYPEEMFTKAVHGMMPKTKLGRKMEKHLFVFRGEEHDKTAQNPVKMELGE